MPQPTFASLSEARRRTLVQAAQAQTQDQTYSGKHLIQGLGNAYFHVNFPVTFSGMPIPDLNAALDPRNPFIVLGASLRVTALVAGWDVTNAVPGAFEGYFTGATIHALVEGFEQQLTYITYSFHGPALTNPSVDPGELIVL